MNCRAQSARMTRVSLGALTVLSLAVLSAPGCSGGDKNHVSDDGGLLDSSMPITPTEPDAEVADAAVGPTSPQPDGSVPPTSMDDGSTPPVDHDGSVQHPTPAAVLIAPADGSYNIATAFACATLSGIEPGASVHYEISTDGSEPAAPTTESPSVSGDQVCGVAQSGSTIILVVQEKDGVLGPVTRATYVLDTTAPGIRAVRHDATATVYTDSIIHFTVESDERGGSASVSFRDDKPIVLRDDGTLGDRVANDGNYETDYTVAVGDDVSAVQVRAVLVDAAANPSAAVQAVTPLTIDTIGVQVGGVPFLASAVWDASGNPYMIDADAVFIKGASLTIQPGVHLVFRNHATLGLRSGVAIVGSAEAPITVVGQGTIDVWPEVNRVVTYDADGKYVTGPRFEYFVAPQIDLLTLDDVNSELTPSLYIAYSQLAAVITRLPDGWWGFPELSGTYIGHSRIGDVVAHLNRAGAVSWTSSRLEDSYFGKVASTLFLPESPFVVTHCSVRTLELHRFRGGAVISHNLLGTVEWHDPREAPALHDNTFQPAAGARAIVVTESASSGADIDAKGNYWGAAASQQMSSLGANANITIIEDFYDHFDQARVLYDGWASAPVAAAGPSW
jgi:hypothetical protein